MKRPLQTAVAFLLAVLASSAAQANDALPRLTVGRTEGSADCPDASALAAAVAKQMGREGFDTSLLASSTEGYDVSITKTEGGYSARIRDAKNAGKVREIDDPGDTCAGLADALALTLAILLDLGNEPPPREAPKPLVAAPPPPPPRAAEAPADRSGEVGASLFGGAAFGVLGPANLALMASIDVRLTGHLALDLGFLFFPTRTIDFPPGEVDVSLLAGRLGACGFLFPSPPGSATPELALCAHFASGGLRGAASGYPDSRSETRSWLAVDAGTLLRGRLTGPLGYHVRAEVLAPITRERFDIAGIDGFAYEASPLAAVLGAGLSLSIP